MKACRRIKEPKYILIDIDRSIYATKDEKKVLRKPQIGLLRSSYIDNVSWVNLWLELISN